MVQCRYLPSVELLVPGWPREWRNRCHFSVGHGRQFAELFQLVPGESIGDAVVHALDVGESYVKMVCGSSKV